MIASLAASGDSISKLQLPSALFAVLYTKSPIWKHLEALRAGNGLKTLALPNASDAVWMSIPPHSSRQPACRGPHAGIDSLRGRDRAVAGLLADYARMRTTSSNAYLVTLTKHAQQCPSDGSPSLAVSYTASRWHDLDGRPASLPILAVTPDLILGVSPLLHEGQENVRPVKVVSKAQHTLTCNCDAPALRNFAVTHQQELERRHRVSADVHICCLTSTV